MKSNSLIVLLLSIISFSIQAQEDEIDRWDNWLLVGNKIVFVGKNKIRHSHELQWRVNENMTALKEWYYEGVVSYTPNSKWEFSPDFRASIKSDRVDYRLGLSGVRIANFKNSEGKVKSQFVQQAKYQFDYDSHSNLRHGVRYVLTYNHIVNQNLIVSGLIGPFYRWSEDFTGIEFVRGGPVFTYIFDKQHTIALAPLFGGANLGGDNGWAYSFTPMISLIIKVGDKFKYTPAKYINF